MASGGKSDNEITKEVILAWLLCTQFQCASFSHPLLQPILVMSEYNPKSADSEFTWLY